MAVTKPVREARARLAELMAQRADLERQVVDVEKGRIKPARALAVVRKRRAKTAIVSNTSGSIWFGSLASITPESYGLSAAAKSHNAGRGLAKELASGFESGALKLNGGRYGVSITLRGLQGRVRIPDKAAVIAHKRAVAASDRADKRAREAQAAEDAALRACFDGATKINVVEAILPDLVLEALADVKLDALPLAHELRHQIERMSWDHGAIEVATQHLKFAESGSTEPCPCRTCAEDRQTAIRQRDAAAARAELPTAVFDCPSCKRRHRGPTKLMREYLDEAKVASLRAGPGPTIEVSPGVHEFPAIFCDKQKGWFIFTAKWADDVARSAKLAARARRVSFTCPDCGEAAVSSITKDDDNVEWVECDACETAFRASTLRVKTVPKPSTAAA